MGGTIEVSKDATGTEAALLYPAALTSGLTAAGFFSTYMRFEQQFLAKSGVTLTFKMQPSATRASAGLHPVARCRDGVLAGEATGGHAARANPVRLPGGRVLRLVGAPQPVGGGLRQAHRASGPATAPRPPSLFQVFRDQSFTYIMPPGWSVLDEHQDNLDLHGDNNDAGVSYLFFGVPPQYDNPPLALAHIFQVEGISVTSVLSVTRLADQQLSTGGVQGQQYEEFLGRQLGKAVHGLVYILTDSGRWAPSAWSGSG